MKLTKRVLALILAAAMVIGMVAVGAFANDDTGFTYYNWDPNTNPYTARIVTTLYLVEDSSDPAGTVIEPNKAGQYEVVPGDLIRVETTLETNYLAGSTTFSPAYTNTIFTPTMNAAKGFATYAMTDKVDWGNVFEYETAAPEGVDDRDGTFGSAPYMFGDGYLASSGTAGGTYNQLKQCYPAAWRGTGTTASNYLKAEGFASELNFMKIAFGAPSSGNFPAKGYGVIVTEPEVMFSYYLTVSSNAAVGKTGTVGQPEVNLRNSNATNNAAFVSCYYLNPAKEGYFYDYTSNVCAVAGCLGKSQGVTYTPTDDAGYYVAPEEGQALATGDITYEVQNCDIVVVESHGGEEPPVPQVDKTALETAINTLPAIAQDQATSASWAAYTEALAAAQEVFDKADATQAEVDAAAAALTEATNGVTQLDPCDYSDLDDAIDAYEDLDLDAFTPASIAASKIAEAYDTAKNFNRDLLDDEDNANQDAIDAAAAALNAAIQALQPKADKAALEAAIAAAQALKADDYTPNSWTNSGIAGAISNAEVVLADDDASEADVTAAIDALTAATTALTPKADKTELEAAIAAAQALKADDYTPNSWTEAALADAIADANGVYNDDNATAEEVTGAINALAAAEDKLVAKADKTALETAINTQPAIAQADATSASWAAYAEALDAANALLADENAAQADVDAAAAALNEAREGVTQLDPCDYTTLDALIAQYDELDLSAFTPTSVANSGVEAAYTAATNVTRGMLNDEQNVNQGQINDAADALDAAIQALAPKADKGALLAAIAEAQGKNADDYTPNSWTDADLAAVIAAAEIVAADDDAAQADVDAQVTALNNAIDKLVAKADKGALADAIAAASAKNADDYTPESWTNSNIENVITDATAVYDDANADDEAISGAIAALTDAVNALVAKADKVALEAALASEPTIPQNEATSASWEAYEEARSVAQQVFENENADQNTVDTAAANLLAAIDAVEQLPECDYTALDALIAQYDELDLSTFTPSSVAGSGVEAAYAAATGITRGMLDDEQDVNQGQINDAADALDAAIKALVEKADKTALETAINTQPAVDEANATAESWAAYQAALTDAQALMADDDAAQADVDAAAAALNQAREGIIALGACDYTTLDALIAQYEDLDLTTFTPTSVANSGVEAAYNAAKQVERDMINDESNANQTQINEAADALDAAIKALVEKADKTALETAINTQPAIAQADATSASWAAYAEALDAANALLADENAAQADVDAAAAALNEAREGVTQLDPCDYTALDAAIADYEDLDLNAYTPASVAASEVAAKYDAAKNVTRGMLADEQGANQGVIDAAAQALANAIDALVEKADKAALIAEIEDEPELTEDTATDASWADYQNALSDANAVVADDNAITKDVEDATAALAAAKAGLEARPLCQYDALDTALALTPAEAEEAYTASTWAAYAAAKEAAEAIDRNLIDNKAGTNQASINDAAQALTDAFNALKISTSNVLSVDYDADTYYAKGTMTYTFKVNGAASKIQVINNDTKATQTYDRYHEKVTIVSYNEAGEEVDYATTEPAYELWTVDLVLAEGGYTVKAKYGKVWDNEGLEMNIEYATYEPAYTAEAKVGDGEYGKAVEIEAKHGSAVTFKVVTPTDVQKIQLALENGKTSTYTAENAVAEGDTLVWTVTRVFRAADVGECTVKTKSISGWTALDDAVITVSVAAAE